VHYGLPSNDGTITLERREGVPEEIKVPGPDERALVHHGRERMAWKVVG
jgi:hypothetical protein